MKKIHFISLAVLTIVCAAWPIVAGLITKPNTFSPNTLIQSSQVNSNFDTIYGEFNGNVDTANIKDDAINSNKIKNGEVQAGDMACSGYWLTGTFCDGSVDNADTLHSHAGVGSVPFASVTGTISAAQHGDLSGTFTDMHSASSTVVADPSTRYSSANVEGALSEIAIFTGYDSAATATTSSLRFIGYDSDLVTTWVGGVGPVPTASVTAGPNTAPLGILVTITAFINPTGGASPCNLAVPLKINGVDLTSDPPDYRFALSHGVSPGTGGHMSASARLSYRVADGWNPAISNTVAAGEPFQHTGSACGAAAVSDFQVVVEGLQ